MSRVHVLPPEVVAKIAAGEVVERPASVVKELVENALDAGATSVDVYLKEAGKQLIHIKDNGSGIDHDDIRHVFQRHATSKITSAEDLFDLHSLGFRGEALYTVGAIADVQLKSRPMASEEARLIHMRGGEEVKFEPAAMGASGTDIRVTEIFYNTPARKKFLKSNISEMNAVQQVFVPHVLLRPDVRFVLRNNDKTTIDVKPVATLAQRLADVLRVDQKHLIEEEYTFQEDGTRIRLVLGNINLQRKRRDLQYLFVNGRPVHNKNIEFNVNDIYRLIFPPQTYGVFAVFIDMPANQVDANIHPTKKEVKIKDEYRHISRLRRMVEDTLMKKGGARTLQGESRPKSQDTSESEEGIPADRIVFGPKASTSHSVAEPAARYETRQAPTEQHDLFQTHEAEPLRERFKRARYIGQFILKYLLFEVDQSLLMVDQHAAQERIMFERFRNQINTGDVEVQPLLTPLTLNLSPQEKIAWEEASDALQVAGFETTQFDEHTVAVHAHPTLIKNPEDAVRSILAEKKHERCDDNVIARRACKASIVTGDKLTAEQVLYQRDELLHCDDPFTCPHGRPTLIEVQESFIDRQFLRT